MRGGDLLGLSMVEAGRMLRAGEVTSVGLTELCLGRIGEVDGVLNAFITVTGEAALAAAAAADVELAAGHDRGPLHGIPVALKDLVSTAGVRTTAGSGVLAEHVPAEDAAVVTRLRAAGAVSLGKLNLHEFAYGTTSANAFYGPVRNPWDTERHPGGSSGGSGAAVAAGLCFAAIGTDTGGSIRIPAALCGTVGLMPTFGLVSRTGVVPLSWSLDHVGPLARRVEDAALFLNAIAGYDATDGGSVRAPEGWDAAGALGAGVAGMRIGVLRSQLDYCAPEMMLAFEEAMEVLRGLGAEVVDVAVPLIDGGFRSSVLAVEAAAYHAEWLRTQPEKYSDEVRALLLHGLTIPGYEYVNDLRLRREVTEQVREVMAGVDVIAVPTCMDVAGRIAEIDASAYRYAGLTSVWDHTGQPVISVPCGQGDGGMPLGLSFVGRPFEEAVICQVAAAYEGAAPWRELSPRI